MTLTGRGTARSGVTNAQYEPSRPRPGTASKYAGAEATADDWLAFTKQTYGTPEALTRASAKQLLMDAGAEIGSWCFRPSSKGTSTVVLCILITARNNVANLRIETKRGGKVDVYDLGSTPISFPSMRTALDHFADPDAEPNNTVPLGNCIALPDYEADA